MPIPSTHAAKPLRRASRVALVAAWCALIFFASDQPDLRVSSDDALDLVLRKTAHLVVFGVLAVLVLRAVRPVAAPGIGSLAAAWGATLAWAVSDEWHQSFVEGRVGHASDVAIDMTGATIALAIWWWPRRTLAAGART